MNDGYGFSIIGFFATCFTLINYMTTSLLTVITKKGYLQPIKDKEQKIVSIMLHLTFMSFITSISLWFTIIGWDNSCDGTKVSSYGTYLYALRVGIGFYIYDIFVMKPAYARMIHHFISLYGYLAVLEENKLVWYAAALNIEAYKLPLIVMQFLYYIDMDTSIAYKTCRTLRMVTWITFKLGSTILGITASSLHGIPNVDPWYYMLLVSITIFMSSYNLYILYTDIVYFYHLIRPVEKVKN